MSLKILLGKFVAFFAGQIPVEGHKNIIDSFQKLIVSPKGSSVLMANSYLKPKRRGRSENFVNVRGRQNARKAIRLPPAPLAGSGGWTI
jgi:hypothetical protein